MRDVFADREQAGRELARRLERYRGADAAVLALPRGGVPVGGAIAQALGLPLDLVLVRKLGVPAHPELAAGAVAGPRGERLVTNPDVVALSGLSPDDLEALAATARRELDRRAALYLGGRAPVRLAGRTAIVADDGIATGATMEAALRAVRDLGARRIVLAVPVAAPEALARLSPLADETECLIAPERFGAVGRHYAEFPQLSDAEVTAWMARTGPD